MKYTLEQNKWLSENRNKYTLKDLTVLFNEKFNVKVHWSVIKCHCQKVLHLKKDYWDKEKDDFLKEYVPEHTAKETQEEFEKRFGEIKSTTLVSHCNYSLDLFFKLYSKEELEFLKSYYPYNSASETHREFEKRFRKINKHSLVSQCVRLGLQRVGYHFTEEEISWIKENYEVCFSSKDVFDEFIKKFGHYHSKDSFHQLASRLGLNKRKWKKEEEEWLMNNYQRKEKTEILYQEFNNLFPNRKTYCAFVSHAKEIGLGDNKRGKYKKGDLHYKTKLKMDLNIPLDTHILVALGNGEYIGVEKDVYSSLRHINGALRNGEVTKTYYDICKVKRMMKDVSVEK